MLLTARAAVERGRRGHAGGGQCTAGAGGMIPRQALITVMTYRLSRWVRLLAEDTNGGCKPLNGLDGVSQGSLQNAMAAVRQVDGFRADRRVERATV